MLCIARRTIGNTTVRLRRACACAAVRGTTPGRQRCLPTVRFGARTSLLLCPAQSGCGLTAHHPGRARSRPLGLHRGFRADGGRAVASGTLLAGRCLGCRPVFLSTLSAGNRSRRSVDLGMTAHRTWRFSYLQDHTILPSPVPIWRSPAKDSSSSPPFWRSR